MLAGYETTANALAFTVHQLASHSDKEAKLLKEVDAWGKAKDLSLQDLDNFPYVDAAFR